MRCVAAIVLQKKKTDLTVRIPPLPPPPAILPLSGHVLVCPQNHAKQKNSILKRILELCPDMYKLVTIFLFPLSCCWACSIKGPDGKTAGQLAEAIAAAAVANCLCLSSFLQSKWLHMHLNT
jgi:hypothetical protein